MRCFWRVNRCTVAGTVYDSHVIPYSPAFKPAPATTKEQWPILRKLPDKKKKNIYYGFFHPVQHISLLNTPAISCSKQRVIDLFFKIVKASVRTLAIFRPFLQEPL